MKTLTIHKGISLDGNTLSLIDETVYGVLLPLRNTLAIIPYITFIPSGGALQVITPAAYNPSDVITFNVNVDGKDGVYYVLVFAFPEWTTGDPLVEGTTYFNLITSQVAKVISGVLTPVTAPLSTLVNDAAINYGEADSIIRVELVKRKDLLQLLVLQKLEALSLKKCEHGEYAEAQRNFNYVRSLMVGAYLQFCMGNKVTAQQYIETGNNLGLKILKV